MSSDSDSHRSSDAAACGAASEFSVIGTSPARIDGVGQVTGAAIYTDDMTLPRMLFGKILRSPHAHAKIISIDTSQAEAMPGVVVVMIGSELPTPFGVLPMSQDETALCIDKVCFVGDGVAAVAAIDERTAQEALAKIRVEYEVLPAVMSIDDALREGLPKIHESTPYANNAAKEVALEFGDVEEAFATADYVREDEFFHGANAHGTIETHCALAQFEPAAHGGDYRDGHLTLWSATQTPHYVHRTLANVLGMPASRIRVVKPHLGGGFGGKSEPFGHEICAAWLAIKAGRPVKITFTREEVFFVHRGRHATRMLLKTGVKSDGTIVAVRYRAWLDGGAYGSFGLVTSYYTGQFLTLPYNVPVYKFESTRLYTNKPPAGPKRGHGVPQPRFAFEAQLDRIASHLGIDPVEIRLRNLVEPNTMTVNALRVTSCGIRECIEKVVEASGWREKHGKMKHGRGIGIAASAFISGAGREINWMGLPHSGAVVKIDRGGGVAVFCGSSDIGQGSNTMLAQLVAETLGIRVDDVRVYEADTDLTPVDLGSYSSRVTFMAGNAVLRAAEDLRTKLFAVVAKELNVAPDALRAAHGTIVVSDDPNLAMTFIDAAHKAEAAYGTLSAAGSYTPPKLGGKYKGAGAGPSPAYSFTAHVMEVEVDDETGDVKIIKAWTAHDCGRALNRKAVEGQLEGSVYMGIGESLYEEMPYTVRGTGAPMGLMRSASLLDYKMPTSLDTPPIEAYIIETIDPEGPLGAKEAGEGPLPGVAPAIANAIRDAVGAELSHVPFTPDRVLAAIPRSVAASTEEIE